MFEKDRDTERYSDSPLRVGRRSVAADWNACGTRETKLSFRQPLEASNTCEEHMATHVFLWA
jgi:hypothetical protein